MGPGAWASCTDGRLFLIPVCLDDLRWSLSPLTRPHFYEGTRKSKLCRRDTQVSPLTANFISFHIFFGVKQTKRKKSVGTTATEQTWKKTIKGVLDRGSNSQFVQVGNILELFVVDFVNFVVPQVPATNKSLCSVT